MPTKINGNTLKHMIISASNNLYNNKKIVDDLNVFPVPDGDTGTNMSLTISAVKKALLDLQSKSCEEIARYAATASLRGARGNSGVILSQLFKGFGAKLAGLESITVEDISGAIMSAKDAAYSAVSKPAEGTILTVARVIAEKVEEYDNKTEDITMFLKYIVKEGNNILLKTTDMLPQLKQAGVVDAGGKGLMVALEGALYYLENGTIVTCKEDLKAKADKNVDVKVDSDEIKYGYCTEFLINKKTTDSKWQKLKAKLEKIGDCVIVIDDVDIIKVHVHTENPGIAIEEALKLGSLINIKIDNMREQSHNETITQQEEQIAPFIKDAFITVASGEGLVQIFQELGCTSIIEGGQTMNPSTDDFLVEINKLNAENIYILPNNKNIILAAEQASKLTDKNVIVVPTKSIVQGVSCMIAFDEDASVEENIENLNLASSETSYGSVTFAARDCDIDELSIKKDDVMGLIGGKISLIGNNAEDVCKSIVERMVTPDKTTISLFRGEETGEENADELVSQLEALYPDLDVNLYYGGQPLYYYFISVE